MDPLKKPVPSGLARPVKQQGLTHACWLESARQLDQPRTWWNRVKQKTRAPQYLFTTQDIWQLVQVLQDLTSKVYLFFWRSAACVRDERSIPESQSTVHMKRRVRHLERSLLSFLDISLSGFLSLPRPSLFLAQIHRPRSRCWSHQAWNYDFCARLFKKISSLRIIFLLVRLQNVKSKPWRATQAQMLRPLTTICQVTDHPSSIFAILFRTCTLSLLGSCREGFLILEVLVKQHFFDTGRKGSASLFGLFTCSAFMI